MAANDLIEEKVDKKVNVKKEEVEVHKEWEDLIEKNRLGKLYSIAQQVSLLAIEWGINPKDIEEQLISPLTSLVDSSCKELVESNKE